MKDSDSINIEKKVLGQITFFFFMNKLIVNIGKFIIKLIN